MSKYGIVITPEEKVFRMVDVPNYNEFAIMENYKIKVNSDSKEIYNICRQINRRIEELLDSDIRVKFEIMVDSSLMEHYREIKNKLGYVTLIDMKGGVTWEA